MGVSYGGSRHQLTNIWRAMLRNFTYGNSPMTQKPKVLPSVSREEGKATPIYPFQYIYIYIYTYIYI